MQLDVLTLMRRSPVVQRSLYTQMLVRLGWSADDAARMVLAMSLLLEVSRDLPMAPAKTLPPLERAMFERMASILKLVPYPDHVAEPVKDPIKSTPELPCAVCESVLREENGACSGCGYKDSHTYG